MEITKKGYESLMAACQIDINEDDDIHRYHGKVNWAIERAKHYAEKMNVNWESVLEAWEANRTYWYMNYYQDCNQPLIKGERVKVFEDIEDLRKQVNKLGFRCPRCKKISADPQECSQPDCDWKSYGLFGTLGKGLTIILKDDMTPINIFMPVAFEILTNSNG